MGSSAIPDVDQYWPEVADDLSLVTWAHATNSKDLLQEALTNDTIMMIEADVLMGRLKGSPLDSPLLPIMAHPPHIFSDLSLQEFVQEVLTAVGQDGHKKGIKLDFKQLTVVQESLAILSSHRDELSFPIWLNADILPGPVNATAIPVDAEVFLSLCVEFFPEATLSVGWTTRFTEAGDPEAQYTTAHVKAMLAVIEASHVVQPVTFPIRAAFVEKSLDSLSWLVTSVPDSTLTVWSSASDTVNMESLLWLQETIGPDQVYFDLPPAQQREFEALHPTPTPDSSSAALFRLWPRGAALWAGLVAVTSAMIASGLFAPSSPVGGAGRAVLGEAPAGGGGRSAGDGPRTSSQGLDGWWVWLMKWRALLVLLGCASVLFLSELNQSLRKKRRRDRRCHRRQSHDSTQTSPASVPEGHHKND